MTDNTQERAPVILGVPGERAAGETRVALVPDVVRQIAGGGVSVLVESGAGDGSSFPDHLYEAAGAEIVTSPSELFQRANVILKVQAPGSHDDFDELAALQRGQVLIAFLAPLTKHDLIEQLQARGVEAFSMDAIPRTTRAQSMDALSSQSNLAGYKSVIMAANALGKIFPLMMTAAGTITPARVLVLGAGVAGLQAIGTAKRLGAVVYGYDVRAVVKEQVESLGARFVELDLGEDLAGSGGYAKQASEDQTRLQQEGLAKEAALADVVITTALIPGRPAPLLITADAVKRMKPGSVVVDLAGEMGGNCELTTPGETTVEHDVTIIAPLNIPGLVPLHASQVYAKNIQSFLGLIIQDGELAVDFQDDIVAGTCIVHDGEVVHALTRKLMGLPEMNQESPESEPPPAPEAPAEREQAPPDAAPPAGSEPLPQDAAPGPEDLAEREPSPPGNPASEATSAPEETAVDAGVTDQDTRWPEADVVDEHPDIPEAPPDSDDYPRPGDRGADAPSRRDTESGGSV